MKVSFAVKLSGLLVAVALLAGCATNRVDWSSRVGHYTSDQAVIDMGPPDKQAVLSDGRKVYEWVTRYNNGSNVAIATGFGYPGSIGFIQSTGPQYYESKLRLTFTTNNILSAWSKN